MEPTSTVPSSERVQLIQNLLSLSLTNPNSQSQQYVYSQLNLIQLQPQTYISLTYLFIHHNEQPIQKIAGITLKAALKRNYKQLSFSKSQAEYLRSTILLSSLGHSQSLQKIQNILIGLIGTLNNSVDFEILNYLIQQLKFSNSPRELRSLSILVIIFQDLRLQAQNYDIFQSENFSQFLKLFTEYFSFRLKDWDNHLCQLCLQCMNLLIPQLHQPQITNQYCIQYLRPILQTNNIEINIVKEVLQGFTQIIQTKSVIITQNIQSIKAIALYSHENVQIRKKWTSLILDVIELLSNDFNEEFINQFLGIVFPKIFSGLLFTQKDQQNLKIQSQQQVNPYSYDEDPYQDNHKQFSGTYTLRRLSVMCLEKLIISYTDEVWELSKKIISQGLNSQNTALKQCSTLLIGIISENVDDYFDDLKLLIPSLLFNVSNQSYPEILRCTSLWSLEKMSTIICNNPQIKQQIKNLLFNCIGSQNTSAVKQNSFNTLSAIINRSNVHPTEISSIFKCIQYGLSNCEKKSLFTILKIIADIYSKNGSIIQHNDTSILIQNLCQKWVQHEQVQSICCGIIECLVAVISSLPNSLNSFAQQIFKHCLPSLKNLLKKQILLRVIDLLSSLIILNIPTINLFISSNEEFHCSIYSLIINEDKQIKHFGYGFIGDISKATRFPNFAQKYIKTILETFDKKNLTTSSNALTCLTDLLVSHPQFADAYILTVLDIAASKLNISHLEGIYLFNFARIYARLGGVKPRDGSRFLQQSLKQTCLGLRATQYQKLTDDAFRGLFLMVVENPNCTVNNFEYLVDSFICYPYENKETEKLFIEIVREYKKSLGEERWSSFLGKKIFLPATVKKIQRLCFNQ